MQPSEDIKSRLDIVDVVSEYVSLKQVGGNFTALCPFHREKSPSFMVSREKQIWHCFGCGKGGDIFSFVMEMEGITFVEALRLLAPKAGVTLRKENPKITSQRNKSLDIMEITANYYHEILLKDKDAEWARKYLQERGLNADTIKEWKIGYSKESWDDIIIFLKSRGYTDNEIFLAGISVKKESTGRFFNRFRDRVMFPISDVNGMIVAFTARVRPEKEATEKMGKYINSPQTLIYDKSKLIFGLDKAKSEIKSKESAIVVEGQMDVITAHQHGFKNIVASSGTALTKEQIALLKRYSNNISLAFDMDMAGQMAAERGIREAMQAEMDIKVITIANGKDPDECIKNNPKEWREAVDKAKPVMQYYFDKVFNGLDLSVVKNRQQAAQKLLTIISKLGSRIEQDFWLKKLSQKIDVAENLLREALMKSVKTKPLDNNYDKKETQAENEPTTKSKEIASSDLLLGLLIKFPELIDYALNKINIEEIAGEVNRSIYNNLIIYYNENNSKDNENNFFDGFKKYLFSKNLEQNSLDSQLKKIDSLVFLVDKTFQTIEIAEAKEEIIKISTNLQRYYLLSQMKQVEKEIIKAEASGDSDKIKELMTAIKNLSEKIKNI